MKFRYLGASGLKISEITYGNWLTHGSQVENDIATECVRAALDAGISTFDTALSLENRSWWAVHFTVTKEERIGAHVIELLNESVSSSAFGPFPATTPGQRQ